MAMNGGVSAERKRHRPQDHVLEDGPVHFTPADMDPGEGDQFGLHPDGRKLLSGKLDKSIMGWDQSEAPALAM
jgi:hypothetical protein